MEESTKFGPRIDEQLKHEEQGDRVEERLRNQGPTPEEDLPVVSRHDLDDVVDLSGVDERSELARFLEPSRFPGTRDDLLYAAEEQHAPDRIFDILHQLPEDTTFQNVQDVWEALGGTAEERF